jgi:hypothetical protein
MYSVSQKYYNSAYEYDINSAYPASLNKITIPLEQPTFKKVDHIPDKLENGFYLCKITGTNKLFRFNNYHNVYKSGDVSIARRLGLTIEIIMDVKYNVMSYEGKQFLKGSLVLKKFNDFWFEQKKLKTPFSKQILTRLWGTLSASDKRLSPIVKKGISYARENYKLIKLTEGDYKKFKFEFIHKTNPFKNNGWARIKPFLLSKVKCHILNYSMDIQDIIVYSHTDSIVTTKEISEFPISDKKAISKLNMDLFI